MASVPSPEAQVVGLRPAVNGVFATFRCPCGETFERYQPELAGVHAGLHSCPACATEAVVSPEAFASAVAGHLAVLEVEEMVTLTVEASRIARSWYRSPAAAALLRHRGVELGPPLELYLVPTVVGGLLLDGPAR